VKVRELLEKLSEYEPDLEVEMAIVCPVDQPDDRVAVDRYPIEVVLAYEDDEEANDVLWFVGGEEADVDAFKVAMGLDEHGHEHEHGPWHEHGHQHDAGA
jgi:hypothetical protein